MLNSDVPIIVFQIEKLNSKKKKKINNINQGINKMLLFCS